MKIYSYLEAIASGEKIIPAHFFITGVSGGGKTYLLSCIRDVLKNHGICTADGVQIPFVIDDATTYTETGYKGKDFSEIYMKVANACGPLKDKHSALQYAIICLDELDKKCIPSITSKGCDSNRAFQACILTPLSGTTAYIDVDDEKVEIDTSQMLFVGCGAYSNLRQHDEGAPSIGFITCASEEDTHPEEKNITIDDMIESGMLEELAGRFMGGVVSLAPLSEETVRGLVLNRMLKDSVKYGIDVQCSPEAIDEFAGTSRTAVGLRHTYMLIDRTVENVVSELFFESESNADFKSLVISIDGIDNARVIKAPKKGRRSKSAKEVLV